MKIKWKPKKHKKTTHQQTQTITVNNIGKNYRASFVTSKFVCYCFSQSFAVWFVACIYTIWLFSRHRFHIHRCWPIAARLSIHCAHIDDVIRSWFQAFQYKFLFIACFPAWPWMTFWTISVKDNCRTFIFQIIIHKYNFRMPFFVLITRKLMTRTFISMDTFVP